MPDFYISRGDQTLGPYSEDQIQEFLKTGQVFPHDEGCQVGDSKWTTLDQLVAITAPPTQPDPPTAPPVKPVQTHEPTTQHLMEQSQISKYRQYKLELITEGGCGTILLGSAGLPIKKIETIINQHAAQGWQVVFQVIEQKRFLLFWTRETLVVTFGR